MSGIEISLTTVVVLVALALVFDFMNGFHDAANSIATIVSTRVLKPHQAVIWAAVFNVIAYFIFELKVASTIAQACSRTTPSMMFATSSQASVIVSSSS